MPKLRRFCLLLFCLTACIPAVPRPPADIQQWAVYYGSSLPASDFAGLDLVVFDRRYHPSIRKLRQHTHVLAYVSIGEVYDDVPERKALEEEKSLLHQHEHWKSHSVDPRSALWRKTVLMYVDDAMAKGFDGVMLDTVDSPISWANSNAPEQVESIRTAAISLIRDIRAAHPSIKIMLNRGLDILPAVASKIDYVLVESIMSDADVSTGQFSLFSPTTYTQLVDDLHRVTVSNPQLQVLTLDYWNMDDVNGLERIYAAQRASGFAPYVTVPDMLHYTPEPTPPARPLKAGE